MLVIGGFKALVMALLTYVLFAPLIKNYNMFYSGFHQSDQTTALGDYLSQFGILLFFVTGFVLFNLNRAITRNNGIRGIFFGARARGRKAGRCSMPVMLALVAAGAAIIWAGTMERWGVTMLALVGLVAVADLRLARATQPDADGAGDALRLRHDRARPWPLGRRRSADARRRCRPHEHGVQVLRARLADVGHRRRILTLVRLRRHAAAGGLPPPCRRR